MPGLWKAWKAKSRLPTLSTSPLGISPTAGEIPTFPQRRRRRRWKSGKPKAGFPLSHRPEDILGKPTKSQGGRASPCARQTLSTTTKGDLSRQPGRRHFQAHAALESNCRFRLMAYWNQFSISGSFVDWNMLLDRARKYNWLDLLCRPLRWKYPACCAPGAMAIRRPSTN